jgi:hypothetical protein
MENESWGEAAERGMAVVDVNERVLFDPQCLVCPISYSGSTSWILTWNHFLLTSRVSSLCWPHSPNDINYSLFASLFLVFHEDSLSSVLSTSLPSGILLRFHADVWNLCAGNGSMLVELIWNSLRACDRSLAVSVSVPRLWFPLPSTSLSS